MKRIFTFLFITTIFLQLYGQAGGNQLPSQSTQNIVPQTPEANAILKSFETPVSLYTGSADIFVPLYSIREGDINFDLKLSYNSTGITVGERASWVGLGWNLSVPTLVRNVRQIPDDFDYGFINETKYTVNNVYNIMKTIQPGANPTNNNCFPCSEIDNLYKSRLLDLESDDYRITLPDGKSISFMVNQERDAQHPVGYIVQFPNSDYKVEFIKSSGNWEITNPQGFKYIYVRGNMINFSQTFIIGGDSLGLIPEKRDQPYTSTWTLSKIISPSNHVLNFDYDPVIYEDCDLVNQTKTVSFDASAFPKEAINQVYTNYSKTRGTNLFISRIWGDFGEVVFNKDERLDFTTFGRKLNSIEIKSKAGMVNKIGLDFDYMSSISPTYPVYTCNRTEKDNDISKRLMLKKVRFNVNDSKPVSYQFNYSDIALPHRMSYARDWWGYYNGQDMNRGLTPSTTLTVTEPNNRNVYPYAAKAGSLKEIIYPTGGKTTFEFESNRGIFSQSNNIGDLKIHDAIPTVTKYYTVSTHEDDTQLVNKVYNIPITVNPNELITGSSQTLEFTSRTDKCIYPENSLPYINSCSIYYTILDGNNNIIRGRSLLINGYSNTFNISKDELIKGLKVKMEVYSGRVGLQSQYFNYLENEAALEFTYKAIDTTVVKNTPFGAEIPFGGLRIKRIENYENIQNPIIKEYKYTNNGIETGTSAIELDFLQTIPGKLFVSSQSRFPMQTGNGSLISYTNAAEYQVNPITNEQNTTSHTFDNRYFLGSFTGSCFFNAEQGGALLSASVPCYEDPRHGKPSIINSADKQKESYEYSDMQTLVGKNLQRVYGMDYDRVIKPSDFTYLGTGSASPTYLGAQFFYYNFKNFDEPDYSKEVKENLNGQEITTKSQYSSLSPNHHQVTKQTTTSPDGTINETTYAYALDKSNQKLINANMIGIPLETTVVEKPSITAAGKTISRSETKYDDAANLLPSSVVSYDVLNNAPSTEVTYNKYDAKGNILQYTTKEGMPTAIVWGYNSTQPIAKVQGATYDQLMNLGLITAIVNASDSDATNPANEPALITALDTFRKNSGLSTYQVSTYTYDPLIGVTSITPPSGIREVYIYDAANRLKEIRQDSKTGNIVKEFKYNYKF